MRHPITFLFIFCLLTVALSAGAVITSTFTPSSTNPAQLPQTSLDVTGDWTGTLDNQEGTYYTNATNLTSFGTPFYTFFNATNTTALAEGTNLYYTSVRDIRHSTTSADYWFTQQTTAGLTQGTNLYYTAAQATTDCATITGGAGLCDGDDATGAGGGVFPFTPTTWGVVNANSTSTLLLLDAGAVISTSSIGNLVSGSLTSTSSFTVPGLTSALVLTGAGGLFAEYTGATCTNQFIRVLSALGAATCATVGTADVAGLDVSDDLNLTAGTNITLTGDDLSVDDVFILNAGDIGTGVYDFGGATSFEIPNGTGPTVDALGECAVDSTDSQLICGDSGNTARVFATAEIPLFAVNIASTSPDFINGGAIEIPKWTKDGRDITQFRCHVDNGTSVVVNVSDNGTNDTETITCAATQTSDTDVATNSTFTADELWRLEIGTITGTVDYLVFEAYGYITPE